MEERPSVLRQVAFVLLTLSSFLLISSGIRGGIPWPEALEVRAKLRAFEETKDEYDAIYIGASDVFRAFRPEMIDSVVSKRGEAFKSFNLGIPGMWSFEADQLVDEIIAMQPAKLDWVFISGPIFKADHFSEIRSINQRSIRWHTPALTLQAMRSIWLEEHPIGEKLRVGWMHLSQLARRTGSYTMGPIWWNAHFEPVTPEFEATVREYRESRGYKSLESFGVPGTRERRRTFLAEQGRYLEAVRGLSQAQRNGNELNRSGPTISEPGQSEAAGNSLALENYNLNALRRQRSSLIARNLKPGYFVMPELTPDILFLNLDRLGELPLLFDYKRPSRYPEFYTVESHFDFWHLSDRAAGRFSRQFGRDLLAVLDAQ